MQKTTGRVTLPSEQNFFKETKELMTRWGADAIRDSDGTKLDEDIKQLDARIYSKYFVARGQNEFIKQHPEEIQQIYLMSQYNMAKDQTVKIAFLEGYYEEQIRADYVHDPKQWWEVIDRTTGDVVESASWHVDQDHNLVVIENAIPWHEYTVSFLAYMTWDPTHMYNHITNDWGDQPHDIPFDVRQPHSNQFVKENLKKWLAQNPDTDVVRFTTFFYHFTLVFNNLGKEKFVDWFGYGASVSVAALEAFAKDKGYRLRPEDIVDEGYYNSTFRVPSKAYLDYIDFIQRFVAEEVKQLVDIVHDNDKEAMMFLGDNWIGTEPYGDYFKQTGIDAVVGSVGDGATLRVIADIPHVSYTEGRYLPYFFPDTFFEGNDPVIEMNDIWLKSRRALLRKPLDRIGFGGYLSLAAKFPTFVEYVENMTDEFRDIHGMIKGVTPHTELKVAVLNAWGKLRTWQTHIVAHGKWYKQAYSYHGILEALSGLPVDVTFISFEDVVNNGVPKDVDVIINAGDVGTAFSGGEKWNNEKLLATLRAWVDQGGGFIGVGDPSATHREGRFFQLANVLGVDKELGFGLSTNKYFTETTTGHFLSEDISNYDFGEGMRHVYALSEETDIIVHTDDGVQLSSASFGSGRGIYISGLPYSHDNSRLLLRAMYYGAHKEDDFYKWYASNVHCEVHVYPSIGKYAIVNNSNDVQVTDVYDGKGQKHSRTLQPSELVWEVI
ncbi:1,3-beta-galactosyl-N-acetylhexosamine phosphorylase [Lentibacillus saliphilus]|uniref:1,3-beta-galactosyl-N-acetylhexosamine phosphorylase n=1 Tax=Lentibacillus saliphilus TaxID=2737028 RepID=UPI001C30B239|nr:1,3-beta-galactosyl-N-acetylhexosamine phosphorylase [Lentibacillus saliphilus]